MFQFLSNVNVHVNNVETLTEEVWDSAFLTRSHDGDAVSPQIILCVARCVQVNKKLIIGKITP